MGYPMISFWESKLISDRGSLYGPGGGPIVKAENLRANLDEQAPISDRLGRYLLPHFPAGKLDDQVGDRVRNRHGVGKWEFSYSVHSSLCR
jgi:hypothetical protein